MLKSTMCDISRTLYTLNENRDAMHAAYEVISLQCAALKVYNKCVLRVCLLEAYIYIYIYSRLIVFL